MNRLQELLTGKLAEGKSFNRMAHEIGINHVSLIQYHKEGVQPNGVNLAILARYFGVKFEDLVDSVTPPSGQDKQQSKERRQALELRALYDELGDLSPTEQLEWLLRIRKEKAAQKLIES